MPKIIVHEKALAHLTRGLYRSPSSVLRELVSNSWDANARKVTIDTNFPLFFRMVIEDDGDGFTKEQFEALMKGGIGNSEKRQSDEEETAKTGKPTPKPLRNDRPVIGRLGIGMLGIAQICLSFTIISKTRNGQGFRARVDLYDLLKEKLDADDASVVKLKEGEVEEIDVGEYHFEDFDPHKTKYGTQVIADDLHPAFVRAFQQSLTFEQYTPVPFEWSKAVEIVSKALSLQQLGDYWRLLWELAVACPIPYLSGDALPDGLITEQQEKLISYDFSLFVDGVQLFKPLWLQNNQGGYTTTSFGQEVLSVYNRNLVFSGYLALQEGTQLRPAELRGILIRIKNVAVGYYDQTRLDDRYNEGPRGNWLTGEIFVDEGLEEALNVDRDSFNRFSPQYRTLQEYIHKRLRPFFSEAYKQIQVRSDRRTHEREELRTKSLGDTINRLVTLPVEVRTQTSSSKQGGEKYVNILEEKDSLVVEMPKHEAINTKKVNRQLASSILAIYEVAMREENMAKQRETFTILLLSLLKEW